MLHNVPVIPLNHKVHVNAVDGSGLEVVGRARITVRIQSTDHPKSKRPRWGSYRDWAYVIKGIKHDVILGLSFMSTANIRIDVGEGLIYHGHRDYSVPLDFTKRYGGIIQDTKTQAAVVALEDVDVGELRAHHVQIALQPNHEIIDDDVFLCQHDVEGEGATIVFDGLLKR